MILGRERAVETVAMMLRAVEAGEWTPPDTDSGDVAMAIARTAVALVAGEPLDAGDDSHWRTSDALWMQEVTHASLAGCYIVIAYTGELRYENRGVYDTEAKARAVAKMHWHDTGQITDVLKLERPA